VIAAFLCLTVIDLLHDNCTNATATILHCVLFFSLSPRFLSVFFCYFLVFRWQLFSSSTNMTQCGGELTKVFDLG